MRRQSAKKLRADVADFENLDCLGVRSRVPARELEYENKTI